MKNYNTNCLKYFNDQESSSKIATVELVIRERRNLYLVLRHCRKYRDSLKINTNFEKKKFPTITKKNNKLWMILDNLINFFVVIYEFRVLLEKGGVNKKKLKNNNKFKIK